MPKRRRNLGERLEHEAPPRKSRMREPQIRCVDHRIGVGQNVDVDRSRSLRNIVLPAHNAFDFLRFVKKLLRVHGGLYFEHQVQEPGLVYHFHWLGFVNSGAMHHPNPGGFQPFNRLAQ